MSKTTEIPTTFMVIDGKIAEITAEDIREGFRACTTLTSVNSLHLPASITSAAFDLESNARDQGHLPADSNNNTEKRGPVGVGCTRKDYMTHQDIAAATAQKLPDSKYILADISDEEWREVQTVWGTYRIDSPVTLILRKGGSTHRVVDEQGVVHCYAAPETGNSILRWKAKEGKEPVRF